MIWGVVIKSEKPVTKTIKNADVCITKAALQITKECKNEIVVSVFIEQNNAKFLLCTLGTKGCFQDQLHIVLRASEKVTFSVEGKGTVHLTGYEINQKEKKLEYSTVLLDSTEMDNSSSEESDDYYDGSTIDNYNIVSELNDQTSEESTQHDSTSEDSNEQNDYGSDDYGNENKSEERKSNSDSESIKEDWTPHSRKYGNAEGSDMSDNPPSDYSNVNSSREDAKYKNDSETESTE